MQVLGDKRRRRCLQDGGPCGQLLGRRLHVVAVASDHVFRIIYRVDDQPAQHDRAQRVELKLVGSDYAEVSAATAHSPEEVYILLLARHHQPAICGHHVDRGEVVAGQSPLRREPAVATPEREAADPGRRQPSSWGGKPKELGLPVELAPQRACVGTRPTRLGIHPHALEAGEIYQYPIVDHAASGDAVPAAADGQRQAILAREVYGIDHVGRAGRAHDERWPLIDHAVVDLASFVVAIVLRAYKLAPEARRELLDGRFLEGSARGHLRVVVLTVHHSMYSFSRLSQRATMPLVSTAVHPPNELSLVLPRRC